MPVGVSNITHIVLALMRSPGVLVPDTRLIRDLNVGAGGGDNADTGETGTQRHGEVTPAQTLAIYTLVLPTLTGETYDDMGP